MVIDKLCPVCGYEMSEGPRDFNICPSCGTEFGLHDVNSSIQDLREVWVENGPIWYSRVIPQPESWNPYEQLLNIFLIPQTVQPFGGSTFYAPAFGGVILHARPRRIRKGVPVGVLENANATIPTLPN